jgi:hypothetical protein
LSVDIFCLSKLAIRWNSAGAFIGTVTAPAPLDDAASLVFKTFLAAPLLDTSSGLYVERKFSGSTTAGRSIDVVGSAIDAYAHHVLVDSGGLLLLTDLQGMSFQLEGPALMVCLFPIFRCRRSDSRTARGLV